MWGRRKKRRREGSIKSSALRESVKLETRKRRDYEEGESKRHGGTVSDEKLLKMEG